MSQDSTWTIMNYMLGCIFLLLSSEMFKGTWCQEQTDSDLADKSSDFAYVVKSKFFADKTMLLKMLLQTPKNNVTPGLRKKSIITAPPGSGKSTALDMIRRFLEIQVDEEGVITDVEITANYKLFKDNNLKICGETDFFKENFGRHPVLFVDFKLLAKANNFEEFLVEFKKVLTKTFSQHVYLKQIPGELKTTKKFEAYMSPESMLSENDLHSGLSFLLKQMRTYFRKPVYILIDNYDGAFESIMFTKQGNDGINRVFNFTQTLVGNLFSFRNAFKGALLTGVVRVGAGGIYFTERYYSVRTIHYRYLDEHLFGPYFGFIPQDLQLILTRTIADDEKRAQINRTLINNFHGYKVNDIGLPIYNMNSILQFLEDKQFPTKLSYSNSFFEKLKIFFRMPIILNSVLKVLEHKEIQISMLREFNKHDVHMLNALYFSVLNNTSNDDVYDNFPLTAFLRLLFHLGFFSPRAKLPNRVISVVIANKENKFRLAQLLEKTFVDFENQRFSELRKLSSKEIDNLYQMNRRDTVVVYCKILSELNAL